MADLEARLTELREAIEFPPTPPLAARVRARVEGESRRRLRPGVGRRAVVAIAIAFAAPAAAVAAVPSTRHTVLRWLRIESVTIERVPTTPTAPPTADLVLGRRVSLDEARRAVSYAVLVPAYSGGRRLSGIHLAGSPPGGRVSLVYRPSMLVTEFRGGLRSEFIHKSAGPGTRIEPVRVGDRPGYWLEGAPHQVVYVGPQGRINQQTLRLATNTLIWTRDGVVLRLEARISKARALRIADSLR